MQIPKYLQNRLLNINIQLHEIHKYDPTYIYFLLKNNENSLSFKVLFDLYAILNNINYTDIDNNLKIQLINQYKQILPINKLPSKANIDYYLHKALDMAKIASLSNEIPIGAVIVCNDKIIATSHNKTSTNILNHAEINAISIAQQQLNNTRLNDCDLYVTIEPCVMCVGAIINAKIRNVVFGAFEPKTGAILSQFQLLANKQFNHQTKAIGPIDTPYYSQLLKYFFKEKRTK